MEDIWDNKQKLDEWLDCVSRIQGIEPDQVDQLVQKHFESKESDKDSDDEVPGLVLRCDSDSESESKDNGNKKDGWFQDKKFKGQPSKSKFEG